MRRRSFVAACAAGVLPLHASGPVQAAPAANDLVFGQIAALAGPLGPQVRQMNAGARLVFDPLNARGGIQGRRLHLLTADDGGDPQRAQAAAHSLLREQHVTALFGCAGNTTFTAVEPLLREHAKPALGGIGITDALRERCLGAAYFVRATLARECEVLAQQLTTVGTLRVAVAHQASTAGDEALRLIGAALADRGAGVTASAAVTTEVGGNISEVAKKLQALQPQAVVMALPGAQAAELMQELAKLGARPGLYGLSLVAGEQVVMRLADQARGLTLTEVMPHPWHATNADLQAYRRLAQAAKVPVGYASLEGYLNACVLVEALQRCGGEFTPARLQAVLRKMQWRHAGLEIDFGAGGHTGSRFVELVQIAAGGKYLR